MENSLLAGEETFQILLIFLFSMFDDPITEVDVFDKMIFYKYIG